MTNPYLGMGSSSDPQVTKFDVDNFPVPRFVDPCTFSLGEADNGTAGRVGVATDQVVTRLCSCHQVNKLSHVQYASTFSSNCIKAASMAGRVELKKNPNK